MKKIIITTILCLSVLIPVVAQDTQVADPTVNKRGTALLPKAGDFAIGIEATPLLQYLGGFMGGNSNTATFDGFDQTIYMKYFLQDNAAIRAKLRLNLTQTKSKETINNDYTTSSDPTNVAATTIDTKTNSNKDIELRVGYELRRGKGRVQGFYGADVNFFYNKAKDKYKYGNPITESNQTPTTNNVWNPTVLSQGYRILENNGGAVLGAGIGAFTGIEYFFAPQISVGAELGLGLNYFIKGQDEFTTEGFLGNEIKKYEYRDRNANDAAFETGLKTKINGNIFIMFHF